MFKTKVLSLNVTHFTHFQIFILYPRLHWPLFGVERLHTVISILIPPFTTSSKKNLSFSFLLKQMLCCSHHMF